MKTIHITNGDSAVGGLKQAGVSGVFLPWRDVLHVGPLEPTDSWEAFDQCRTRFMVNAGWGSTATISESFAARRAIMDQLSDFDQVYLWFEHDLYDQLQLMQILVWLGTLTSKPEQINMIVTDLYLGYAEAEDFHDLFRFSEALTNEHIQQARHCWAAVTHKSPDKLSDLIGADHTGDLFPFMAPAIKRLGEEYPDPVNGLNRTESAVLNLLTEAMPAGQLFRAYQNTEEAMFMGDMPFWDVLEALIGCEHPLLHKSTAEPLKTNWQQELSLTECGKSVLLGTDNHLALNGINKWIGGVRLKQSPVWCYDSKNNQFSLWEAQ